MGITPHGFTKGSCGGADAPPAAVPPSRTTREASAQRAVDGASPDGPGPRMRQSQCDRRKVKMMDVFGPKLTLMHGAAKSDSSPSLTFGRSAARPPPFASTARCSAIAGHSYLFAGLAATHRRLPELIRDH